MLVTLSEDQALLRDTTARFVEAELPVSATRELHENPAGYTREWLRAGAELGWFSMLVPEAWAGGSVSAEGVIDAAMLAEVMGRHVQPGPFVPMNIVAAALAAAGHDAHRAVVASIVAGETVATWAFSDTGGSSDDGAGVRATSTTEGFVLSGRRGFVQDAQTADVVLVTATLGGEPAQLLVSATAPAVSVNPLTTLDLSRRLAHVSLDGVVVGAEALVSRGAEAIERQLQIGVALNVAETVGAMDALFSLTVQYAKDRVAFGRPIGSFQALKHLMADLALALEASKAGAVAAARAVAASSVEASEVVSMVASFVGDAGHELAQECLQILGGIGYTWEHDLHLYMRRIRSNASLYGEPTWHRERVCALHGLGVPG